MKRFNRFSEGSPAFLLVFCLVFQSVFIQASRADIELPRGSLYGCPFIHNDQYDVSDLLTTLKAQLSAQMENRSNCRQAIQSVVSTLAPLQDFYRTLNPTVKQQISKSVYANALTGLGARKLELESSGQSASSAEYATIISEMATLQSSDIQNEIDLESLKSISNQSTEAYYRSQLLTYTSNVLNAYATTAKGDPKCIGAMGGWGQALSTVIGGVSLATGLGVNPSAPVISAAALTASMLVELLVDSKIRAAYDGLIQVSNYETLSCTYYAVKKSACEYRRAYALSEDTAKLRAFLTNHFEPGYKGEYDRYFVNVGRVKLLGDIFSRIAKMGSPLTLDTNLFTAYLIASAVDFVKLGDAPSEGASPSVIKAWLFRAKTFGVNFQENDPFNGPNSIEKQFAAAKSDIANKKATIETGNRVMKENLSFLDLRRSLSSDYANARSYISEMKGYLKGLQEGSLVRDTDKETIQAGYHLIDRLDDFLSVTFNLDKKSFEDEVVTKGGIIFAELAGGALAQISAQSVLALGDKGVERLGWSFGVIRNAYLNRDRTLNIPQTDRFGSYSVSYDALAEVTANYSSFTGNGTAFRSERVKAATESFEKGFKKEMLRSLELSMEKQDHGIPELEGETAGRLCAMYAPSLQTLAGVGLFGENKAAKILAKCQTTYKKLKMNRLVTDLEYTIDYKDDCTFFNYSRELEIQNLIAKLM